LPLAYLGTFFFAGLTEPLVGPLVAGIFSMMTAASTTRRVIESPLHVHDGPGRFQDSKEICEHHVSQWSGETDLFLARPQQTPQK